MLHRVRQFLDASAAPSPRDFALAEAHLPPALFALFAAQHPRDVVHAARTARWLLGRGYSHPDLVVAALLHDIAKGNQRRLDRAAFVLASSARLTGRLASPGSAFEFRRALHRSLSHAAQGARMLVAAGANERVVALVRDHHTPSGAGTMLALLQEADAAS
jgi:putative nucleotidyltransferase with HDIG domain